MNIRFPIGQFEAITNLSSGERENLINQIPEISKTIRNTIQVLEPTQLHIPYRQDGWTVQQIVHHIADNDLNAYLRFKRALTEDEPMSSSYREDLWAELSDYREVPIENSLVLLETLHARFAILLRCLQPDDYQRTLRTQVLDKITLDIALQRFVWHSQHHISQIKLFIDDLVF
ncbi:metal-dependent hydrolase [Paenibacillus selenitireducens]|uniref:Metal-dependent hydrolase n=1 Tax=Paenibacillus selenitireducens TaxID=1324314 RepID=A0A1T2X1Q3_9BACL|nr:putative metal-dependent hydrolase [Paenibacillus selenitireducens]OPA73767.1 metal-dependent hydrolase [Paenibacillus selenitireducens]